MITTNEVIDFKTFTGDNAAEVADFCIKRCPLKWPDYEDYEFEGNMLWVNAGSVNGGTRIFKGETVFCYFDKYGDTRLLPLGEPFAQIVIEHINEQKLLKAATTFMNFGGVK